MKERAAKPELMSFYVTDPVKLSQDLIACPSVTPEDAGAQILLADILKKAGFYTHHLPFKDVPNLFARIGTGGPHICFAGHTDVVPPGPVERWTYGPFNPHIEGDILYGRGASDMKSNVAAFVVAGINFAKKNPGFKGSISYLITGDEEGPADFGTVKVLEWMKENGHVPDVALVGEPTNPAELGDEIKIGRRGSLSGKLVVKGKQGHVGYPHLADNPVPKMVKFLEALNAHTFDTGNEFFSATNLEVTSVDTGNTVDNVIPAEIRAAFNIRFNSEWSGQTLSDKVRGILDSVSKDYDLTLTCGAESFLTKPGEWSEMVRGAVEDITGRKAAYTTHGGTSDARFVKDYCPVVEFGLINKTVHQIDENTRVSDIEKLTLIYERILERYFAKSMTV